MLLNLQHNLLIKAHGAFQETGQKMVGYAYGICPVRTGYLRSTIYFEMTEQLNYEFGAKADYAIFVEFGTWKMAAQPFIRPAYEAYQTEILDAVVRGIIEGCKA
jgi:HK97 gp10 family phage protein